MKKVGFWAFILLMIGGCSHKNITKDGGDMSSASVDTIEKTVKVRGGSTQAFVLKTTAFKMSGDYSNNVAVRVGKDGRLSYYPAPGDISLSSAPVALVDGWWLDRQGIGKGYQFTRYTFEEYSQLKETPSAETLLESVIPGAVVTSTRQLSVPASEAMDRLDEIKRELSE